MENKYEINPPDRPNIVDFLLLGQRSRFDSNRSDIFLAIVDMGNSNHEDSQIQNNFKSKYPNMFKEDESYSNY